MDNDAGHGPPPIWLLSEVVGSAPEHRTLFVATALSGGQRARKANKSQQSTT